MVWLSGAVSKRCRLAEYAKTAALDRPLVLYTRIAHYQWEVSPLDWGDVSRGLVVVVVVVVVVVGVGGVETPNAGVIGLNRGSGDVSFRSEPFWTSSSSVASNFFNWRLLVQPGNKKKKKEKKKKHSPLNFKA